MTKLKLAGLAAALGCVACCTLPLLGVAGLTSGAGAGLSGVFAPGNEFAVAAAFFSLTLLGLTVWSRFRPRSGCGDSCKRDGTCCDHGAKVSP
ncbi:MAG: hypothetical protein JNM17_17585 [Archangium sp.]|nr:hypothetical protein [Archangium sp.]